MSPVAPEPATTPAGNQPGLLVEGVEFAFGGNVVLDGFAAEVPSGCVLSLLGPSGCGKTTLLRVVAGLEVPSAGSVSIEGRLLTGGGTNVVPEQRRVAMVFQDWALFPHLDVASNIAFGLPAPRRRDGSVVGDTLALVGLEGLGARMPSQLSGGQQQRVALGRALAQRPDVLLLDEPFSNLDAALRSRVRADVHRLLAEVGVTTVLVTHDRDEAFVLGDEVAVMRRGRSVQQGRPREVYERPVDEWTARMVGEVNVIEGRADGASATTSLGRLALAGSHDGQVRVVLRPEQLVLRRDPEGGGVVSAVEYRGPATAYEVVVGGKSVRAEVAGPAELTEGESVDVVVAAGPFPAYAAG